MGKRLTATEKWDKEWFMSLSCKLKCLWMFINDKCDQAGMWEANYMVASMFIGERVTESDVMMFGDRIEKFSSNKIWIVDHVEFQCGTLSDKSPAHKPIFKLLTKYKLLDRVLGRVSNTLQEKEKEIEKELEEEKEAPKHFSDDRYVSAKHAFTDITGNYKETEKYKQILYNRGWRVGSAEAVEGLLYHFLHAKADLEKDRKDIKQHFKNWINREQLPSLIELAKNIATGARQAIEVPGYEPNLQESG